MFQEFIDFMSRQQNYKIYYYTQYESLSLRRLSKKYGTSHEICQKIIGNMVDPV